MNQKDISENMKNYIMTNESDDNQDDILMHYGTPQKFAGDPHGSGRYREGSGENPYQHEINFLDRVDKLKKDGWKETKENIMKEFKMTTTEYRREISICKNNIKDEKIARAKRLHFDNGYSTSEVARRMNESVSTVSDWLKTEQKGKENRVQKTANFLKQEVDKKKMIDVGLGVENDIRVTRDNLDTAIQVLEHQGYNRYIVKIPQMTTKNKSTMIVLAAPGVEKKECYNFEKVKNINEYVSRDNGESFERKFHRPASIDSKRVKVILKDEKGPDGYTGQDKDGLIEIRRGVKDLSLGENRYAQVRILCDGDKYLKGMAIYSDAKNWPKDVDIVFNSNKKTREDAFKKIKEDPDNPFGATIKPEYQGGQYWYDDKTGKRISGSSNNPNKKLGAINIKSLEGDWSEWKNGLPSQFLSKQNIPLIKRQLQLDKDIKKQEFDEIMSLTNPTVKKYYLSKFANECDGAAKDLKAASLPGQKYHVILPINAMGDSQIYAPNYENGTKLALIRYPHGGTFEIPILTVNNNNPTAKKILSKDIGDAVGISHKVADRLSGADFDGDTVMCIPTGKNGINIKNREQLQGLIGFDTKVAYGPDSNKLVRKDSKNHEYYVRNGREFRAMTKEETQKQMGIVSNLITDMTLIGANDLDLARAVRHSMVVIDAEKHKLDWQQSEKDNNIAELKKKYQTRLDKNGDIKTGGASTIISRAKGQAHIDKTKGQPWINQKGKIWYDPSLPEGALITRTAPDSELYYAKGSYDKKKGTRTYTTIDNKDITYHIDNKEEVERFAPKIKRDEKGNIYATNNKGDIRYKVEKRTETTTQMDNVRNAEDLMSVNRWPKEQAYADYANYMKSLANQARKEMVYTENLKKNPEAAKKYAKEVSELAVQFNNAGINKVKERTAQRLANAEYNKKIEKHPDMALKDKKKLKQQLITKYRTSIDSKSKKERMLPITDKQWEAIQSGAISEAKLKVILENVDPDSLRERSMPKSSKVLSASQISRIKAMNLSGNYTLAEIALRLNVSPSTVSKILKGDK